MKTKDLTPAQQAAMKKLKDKGLEWVQAYQIGVQEQTLRAMFKKGYLETKPYSHNQHLPMYRIVPTFENLGIKDIGEISITEADEMNIPVNCRLYEPEDGGAWRWDAYLLQPRRRVVFLGSIVNITERNNAYINLESSVNSTFKLEAPTKEALIWAINKYVTPLYRAAVEALTSTGELYYWEVKEDKPGETSKDDNDFGINAPVGYGDNLRRLVASRIIASGRQ